MKWIHEEHGPCPSLIEGVEPMKGYVVEGWLIETEEDKDNFILCRCGNKTPIKSFRKTPCIGWNDELAAPIWDLECPHCFHLVGVIEEQTTHNKEKILAQREVNGVIFRDYEKKTRVLFSIKEGAEMILK